MVKVPARPKSQASTATPRVGPASMLASSTEAKGKRKRTGRETRAKMRQLSGDGVTTNNPGNSFCRMDEL